MYADEVPVIEAAMRYDAQTFANGVMFAILSARVPFGRTPEQCRDLAKYGEKSKTLWSWKLDAYKYLTEHRDTIWHAACARPKTKAGAAECIAVLTRIPGLGIVKAAFVAQMIGHNVACIDARNIQRDGRNPREYRSDGEARKVMPAFARKIERYVHDTWGQAQHYWDVWCNEVGPDYGMTGAQCSKAHVDAIVPAWYRITFKRIPATMADNEVPF